MTDCGRNRVTVTIQSRDTDGGCEAQQQPNGQLRNGKSTLHKTTETPPPRIRNCCGRIARGFAKAHHHRDKGPVVDHGRHSSQLELDQFGGGSSKRSTSVGGSSTTGDTEEENASIGSQKSATTTSSSALPDPLSPGLVNILAPVSFFLLFSATVFIYSLNSAYSFTCFNLPFLLLLLLLPNSLADFCGSQFASSLHVIVCFS